jgi:hypothetical protein
MSKQLSASRHTEREFRRRRARGVRVFVGIAVCGLAGALALGGGPRSADDGALQSDVPHTQSPALLDLRFRREAVA